MEAAMKTDHIEHPDFLVNERINLLLKHGYYGYEVVNFKFDAHRGQIIVVARDDGDNVLSTYGETKEEACRDLIDLIAIKVGTL